MDNKTIQFIKEHEKDNIQDLALRSKRYPNIDMPFVLEQIAGRQIAKEKLPTWYNNDFIIYPKHISLEQCSSEKTARYKASLCKGDSFVDLTGGLGVDFSFMSQNFKEATYVEKQHELVKLAKQNFSALELKNTTAVVDDAENYLRKMQTTVDTIYIDPSRRNNSGSKVVLIEDCTPDLREIEIFIEKNCTQAIIKLSPMLDISQALNTLKKITEVHIISSNNECKELLFIKNGNLNKTNTTLHCINILTDNKIDKYTFERESENDLQIGYTTNINTYLYEPNSSVIKGGAYKSISRDLKVSKIHPNSHLYTSEELIENFPGRKFIVKRIIPFNKKEISGISRNIEKANITVRNFPLSVEELRKKIKIKDGGENYIFATTTFDEKRILILCEKYKQT